MKSTIFKYWDVLRSSFWFIPSLMVIGATVLAFAAVALDQRVTSSSLKAWGWIYSGGAEGASAVLQTIASSMVGITGIVFSMTLVALTLASSQFGPRLLRNFMRDTVNQVVLGIFISTFLYCLLVLRTIRRADESAFVPHLAVTLGVVFALTSIFVLIYFIHHVAVSIQVDEIVSRVSAELTNGIDRLFPLKVGEREREEFVDELKPSANVPVKFVESRKEGYLQFIDANALIELADEVNVVIRIEKLPGAYFLPGDLLMTVWPGERAKADFVVRMTDAFVFGNQRTPAQDLELPIHELVEIAVRALSPGINDPFTAMTCINRLGAGLCRLAERQVPLHLKTGKQAKLRIITPKLSFRAITDEAFDQIRQNGRTNCPITFRLLETIASTAVRTSDPDFRNALQRQAEMIIRGAREALPELEDKLRAEKLYQWICDWTKLPSSE